MPLSLDAAYKLLFSHPEIVRELLSGFVPVPWLKQLKLSVFQRVNASYVSAAGRQRHDDMVWRLDIGGDSLYLYLLLEFQARPDPWMALRVQEYVALFYLDLARDSRLTAAGRLPPVLPIVLYCGAAPWSASTDVGGLLRAAPPGLAQWQPQQRYLLIDERHCSVDPADAEGNLLGTLFGLQRARSRAAVRAVLDAVFRWLRQPAHSHLRTSLTAWVGTHLKRQWNWTSMDMPDSLEGMHIMTDEMFFETAWEEARYEGIQQGKAEGRAEGIAEGVILGKKASLISRLERQFGGLPPALKAQIKAASVDMIERWDERAFSRQSLDAIFAVD
jgi:hypothetical protein